MDEMHCFLVWIIEIVVQIIEWYIYDNYGEQVHQNTVGPHLRGHKSFKNGLSGWPDVGGLINISHFMVPGQQWPAGAHKV